jgi:lipopolysaccharide biosynthesis glycosyltransferase
MESIIQNCPEKLDFAVIYYDLSKETRDIFSRHFEQKVKSLEFYEVEGEVILKFKAVKNVPHIRGLNVFLRLLIDKILPKSDKYIVYLDCDIIVLDNILKITDGADLNKPVCAVTEYNPAYKWRDLTRLKLVKRATQPWIQEAYWYRVYQNLEMKATASYFNAGVMVINLEYWREHKIAERAVTFLLGNPEKCYAADQDALNHAINGNYCALAPRWNSIGLDVFSNYPAEELKEAIEQPSLLHIVGANKPWKYECNANAQKLYWKYRHFSPWPKKEYHDKTLGKIVKKQTKQIVGFIIGYKLRKKINLIFKREHFRSKIRLNT